MWGCLVLITERCDDEFFMHLLRHHNEKILGRSLHLPYMCFFFHTGAKLLIPTEEFKSISEELNK
jgi:hypothetical protein